MSKMCSLDGCSAQRGLCSHEKMMMALMMMVVVGGGAWWGLQSF
jgi:hypothetical protein